MRYIRNPKSFLAGTNRETGDEVYVSFARSWLRGLFGEKSWCEGKTEEARTKLEALQRILEAVKGHENDGDEWGITDEDHEVLCRQALAFNVEGDLAVFRTEFHMFRLAIVSATSKPTKSTPESEAA